MSIHVKNTLIGNIETISLDVDEQVKYYHETEGRASVTELIETWFGFMPGIIVNLLQENVVNYQEAKLLMQFNDEMQDISHKLDYGHDEYVFKNDPNWAKLREKAKEIYKKLQEVKS